MFYAINKCDNNSKQWIFFTKMNDYHKKMCDTNKNVIKMGVTINEFLL
jgi:hypothetical protein